MTPCEKLFMLGAFVLAGIGFYAIEPALQYMYRVPDWRAIDLTRSGIRSDESAFSKPIAVVPYRGYYPGSVELRIRGGPLRDAHDAVIPSSQIRPYIEALCRVNPERPVVLLASPQEGLGGIVRVANEARSAAFGQIVVMYDHPL